MSNTAEVLQALRKAGDEAGSQKDFVLAKGFHPTFIGRVLKGLQEISPRLRGGSMTLLPAPYSYLSLPNSAKRATANKPPDATKRRISGTCRPAASVRGLPKLFSSTIVPISAKPNPMNHLRFFMHPPTARIPAPMHCDRNAGSVSSQQERRP